MSDQAYAFVPIDPDLYLEIRSDWKNPGSFQKNSVCRQILGVTDIGNITGSEIDGKFDIDPLS